MKNILKTTTVLIIFICLNSVAASQHSSSDFEKIQKRHIETSECIAFYNYGYALTKRNKDTSRISNKFKALDKFLRKQLKLDVEDKDIDQVRKMGRQNLKKHMEENDHTYDVTIDGHDDELLDLFKRYNPQCSSVIKYYQEKNTKI